MRLANGLCEIGNCAITQPERSLRVPQSPKRVLLAAGAESSKTAKLPEQNQYRNSELRRNVRQTPKERKRTMDKTPLPEEHRARLIPVSGKQELRATSALLAVLSAVDEFGMAFVRPFDAPKGKLEAYTEIPFKLSEEKEFQPDGLLRVRRGKRLWTALVEVKTANNLLEQKQIEEYLDVARQEHFDCLITISNQIARIPGEHPVTVHGGKLRSVGLHHVSWSRVLTLAHVQQHSGVADKDQAWILDELIRYLAHENAGAVDFQDMGKHWVKVRSAVRNDSLLESDNAVEEIAGRWEELLTFVALKLGRRLGAGVQETLSKAERQDLSVRIRKIVKSLASTGEMTGAIHIPNTVGDIEIVADLRGQQISASVLISAPESGRATKKINWLLHQLRKESPDSRTANRDSLFIESWGARNRRLRADSFSEIDQDPKKLVPADNRDIVAFRVTLRKKMGEAGRARGEEIDQRKRAFVDSVLKTVEDFYDGTVQHLQLWQRPAPKMLETASNDGESPMEEPQSEMEGTDSRQQVEQGTGDNQ